MDVLHATRSWIHADGDEIRSHRPAMRQFAWFRGPVSSDAQPVAGLPADSLIGTPYLLPEDVASSKTIGLLGKTEAEIAQRLKKVRGELAKVKLRDDTSAVQSTREIFESNQIEGLGPDLSGTWEVLRSPTAGDMAANVDHELMTRSIAGDRDMRAVLSLHGARLLARQVQEDIAKGRPLTEADLRGLHSIICAGEGHEGQYKRWHVQIGGENPHEPHLPVDVGASMYQLAEWFRESRGGSGILRAAAAHAWLTHIHPFEDGNGRLARLLANIALAQAGLPPAIVKSSSQRGPYLDALRHSDDGGDILPLGGLFLNTLKRYIKEVERPRFLQEVFQDELRRRGASFYDWWSREFEDFLESLNAELGLRRLRPVRSGRIDFESFRQIQQLRPDGNAWLEVVQDSVDREVLMWFGYPSQTMRQRMGKSLLSPSIYISVPGPSWSLQRYRRAKAFEAGGLKEIAIIPAVPTKVYILVDDDARGERLRQGGVDDGTDEIATRLAEAIASQPIPNWVQRIRP